MIINVTVSGTKDVTDRAISINKGEALNAARQAAADTANAEAGLEPGDPGFIVADILPLGTDAQIGAAFQIERAEQLTTAHNSERATYVENEINKSELRDLFRTLDPAKLGDLKTFLEANQV